MVKLNRVDAERLIGDIVRERGEGTIAQCVYSNIEDIYAQERAEFDYASETAPTFAVELEVNGLVVDEALLPADASSIPIPICVVGCAVYNLGGADALLQLAPERPAYGQPTLRDMFDPEAINFLSAVQFFQDRGKTWGEALQLGVQMPYGLNRDEASRRLSMANQYNSWDRR